MPISSKNLPPSPAVSPPVPPDMSPSPLTLYDAYLDLSHPAASVTVNEPRLIIAPPPGKAMEAARAVGQELSTEKGLAMVARFCFPEFDDEAHGTHSFCLLLADNVFLFLLVTSTYVKCNGRR